MNADGELDRVTESKKIRHKFQFAQ